MLKQILQMHLYKVGWRERLGISILLKLLKSCSNIQMRKNIDFN